MKKKFITALVAGIFFLLQGITLHGQHHGSIDQYISSRSKGIAHSFAKKYRLDEVQQARVEETFVTYYKSIDRLRGDKASKTAKSATYREIVKRRDQTIKEILPPNQWQKYVAGMTTKATDSLAIFHKQEIQETR